MPMTQDDKILYLARRNKWTLCYLALICTTLLVINIYYLVKDH
jgi:hypothetical protein